MHPSRKAQPQDAQAAVPADRRHPAMSGLNVSPVHGRHCICNRCTPDDGEQRLPLAG
jgi:hypothetical protein